LYPENKLTIYNILDSMKKFILLFTLAIISFYGYSQSLALADSAGAVANNSARTISGVSGPTTDMESYMFVKNLTGAAANVMVKKVEVNLISGTVTTFCWGLCFPPNVFISPSPETIGAGRTDSVDFAGHYSPQGVKGESTVRYVFYIQSNPSDSVCFTVHYSAFPVGVNNLTTESTLSGAYPNPANNMVNFNYSLNSGTEGNVIIRNLLGSVVKNVVLPNAEGKLSVNIADLPEGVYFYSLDVAGKTISTHKLIVKH
jgi:hypothetical protein